jgi:hypothetical protein
MQVMNTQSSKKQTDLARLKFYVVPAAWMFKAWPVLTAQTVPYADNNHWRQDIGKIECRELLQENAVSSDSEEDDMNGNNGGNGVATAKVQQQEQQTRKARLMSELNKKVADKPREKRLAHQPKATLRRELKHEQDFFLLGSNAWLLIKEKFGCDEEIEKECVFDPTCNDSPLAVVLHERGSSTLVAADSSSSSLAQPQEQLEHPVVNIPIPPTGRFRYEQYLDDTTAKLSNNHKNHNRPLDRGTHPGNVSEDDTDPEHGDDLVSPYTI